jgi:transposase
MKNQAKKIVKIINETSNDYDAVDEITEFLKKSEIETIKQVIVMLNKEIKVLRIICYLTLSLTTILILILGYYDQN